MEKIVIRGARQHNLKNIDLELPRNRLTVITGLSGSGKSTLAFDTLYAEGQRRYVESLSAYARQFLERMEKPDVDAIEGLSPAIAIEQKSGAHNPRSTVGTVTEIYDYLRLLYARVGEPHCPACDRPLVSQTIDQMVDRVAELPEGTRLAVLAPLVEGGRGSPEGLIRRLRKEGFARLRIDGVMVDIEEVPPLSAREPHRIEVVVDRLAIKTGIRNRLADSLELALAQGRGAALVAVEGGAELFFSEESLCRHCGIRGVDPTPAALSFNSPQGACPRCDGLGRVVEFDPERIVPDPSLGLAEGALKPLVGRRGGRLLEALEALVRRRRASLHTPFRELPVDLQHELLYGSGASDTPGSFPGVIPLLQRRLHATDSPRVREELGGYQRELPCPECGGARLNAAGRAVRLAGESLPALCRRSIDAARRFLEGIAFSGRQEPIARRLIDEIAARLHFLERVGLAYLTLDRPARTLSGGESQRIRLATQIGSKLSGVLYVLDEPSIGLHPRDNRRLLEALIRLRDLGNTVIVVEHDEEAIRCADHVVDMGPGAGKEGGRVVCAGTASEIAAHPESLTGQYLSGRRTIPVPAVRRDLSGPRLVLSGATHNNLKSVSIAVPVGRLTCVTGVSGSGKSSLVTETLIPALRGRIHGSREPCGPFRELAGSEHFDQVVCIDQAPIGRTPRSNPGTYVGLLPPVRELFARTPEARRRGYTASRFSFNLKGGRCEACQGEGVLSIAMHFLPDIHVVCDGCRGRRFNRETLEVRYKGKNIAEVLETTVAQGLELFGRIGAIREKLEALAEAGLGYLQIGQPASTLSGGEAQRVKLARELGRRGRGRTLYVLDEPTTGLHIDDIRRLLQVLERLVDGGNTVIVIEHHMEVVKTADYVIDLGPGGGDEGGRVVGCGTPEQIAALPGSPTAEYLARALYPRPGDRLGSRPRADG